MADYKVPNLCGASDPFNALQSKFDDMINTAASPAGLIADAASLATSLIPNVTSLLAEVESMLPELPTLPDVNLQAELTSLSGLTAGSFAHGTLLAEITTKFGTALSAGGFSIDTLVDTALDAVSGIGDGDICGGLPNFTIPAIGGTAVEKAVGVKQADVNSVIEKVSVQLANPNVTEATTNATTAFSKFFRKATETGTLPTEDTGSYTVTTKSTTISSPAGGPVITGKVTTPKDATVVSDGKSEKKNTSETGFATRPVKKYQNFIEDASVLKLRETPAGGYALRMGGYIDLSNPSESDKSVFTETELERGIAFRRIWPEGHINSRVDGIKIADEYVLNGKEITIQSPRFLNYTGKTIDMRSKGLGIFRNYFKVLYKYNSKYDPN